MPYYKDLKCIMKIIKKKEESNKEIDLITGQMKKEKEKKNKVRKDARDRDYAIKVC